MKEEMKRLENTGIGISFQNNEVRIELFDNKSSFTFVEVILKPRQFVKAISGLYNTPCSISVGALDKIDKQMMTKNFKLEISKELHWSFSKKEDIKKLILKKCPKGWIPDLHLGSQDTFFTKDDKHFVQTIIRKWE